MSKPKQATLFQTWGSKKTDPKPSGSAGENQAAGNSSVALSKKDVLEFNGNDDDEDLLLAMAMEESLREIGQGNDQPSCSTSSRNVESGMAGKIHNPKPQTSRKGSSSAAPTKGKMKMMSHAAVPPSTSNQNMSTLFQAVGKKGSVPIDNDRRSNNVICDEVDTETQMANLPEISDIPDLAGFDKSAGRMWIYPTNYPVRKYQFDIVHTCLFTNTLVTLPTGLGKTFIGAVVMYNFYRWYPQGKIIFMAPTKPLVAQQIEACYNIMGIPQEDSAEMTGAMQPSERKKAWHVKRVFYLTPQVLTNDLSRGACPALDIKCLVVDEAHKSLGNHAYCQVVREVVKYNKEFRVLALSATPGSDIKAVQQVINNLLISSIELRTEDSADIKQYSHERKVDKIVVPLGEELTAIKDKYLRVVNIVVSKLKRLGVIYNRDVTAFSKFLILKARDAFRQNPPMNMQRSQFGAVEGDFAMCMSLYHGLELLQLHGLRSLFNFMEGLLNGDKGYGRTRTELMKSMDFRELMQDMREKFDPVKCPNPNTQMRTPSKSQAGKTFVVGHPKMSKLQEVVLDHFCNFESDGNDGPAKTRIMIFSQYRDSVNEITEMLNRHRPMVRVMSFIGQSSAGKGSKGFTQKEQLKVMKQFREGGFNTLVSTCVGEEGLDIGDVDLIICFDAHKSPIRLVQRMGRTGRKRGGRIVMLVTAGKEEQVYNQSQYSKKSIHKAIMNGAKSLMFYPGSTRLVPDGLEPVCHKMYITVHEKFIPQNKSKHVDGKQKSITNIGGSKKSTGKKMAKKVDEFLSNSQLHVWTDEMKLEKNTLPQLPNSKFVTLGNKDVTSKQKDQPYSFCLSEWTSWQNRLQKVKFVDHSRQTKTLVELMEFMEVQNAVGDEDNYGIEMRTYLNEDDIIRPGSIHGDGILKFCTPQQEGEKASVGKKIKERKRKNRSSALPEFNSDENGSSDELPEVNVGSKKKNTKTKKKKSSIISLVSSDDEEDIPMENVEEGGNRNPHKEIKKKRNSNSSVKRLSDSNLSEKEMRKSKNIKKSPGSACVNKSFIKVIEDHDKDDFMDFEQDDALPTMPMETSLDCDGAVQDQDVETEETRETLKPTDFESLDLPNVEVDLQSSLGEMEKVEDEEDRNFDCRTDFCKNETRKPEAFELDDPVLNELFPMYTPHGEIMADQLTLTEKKCGNTTKRVPTPPRIEELVETFKEFDRKGRVSPIDVSSLTKVWERDRSDRESKSDNLNGHLKMSRIDPVQDMDSSVSVCVRKETKYCDVDSFSKESFQEAEKLKLKHSENISNACDMSFSERDSSQIVDKKGRKEGDFVRSMSHQADVNDDDDMGHFGIMDFEEFDEDEGSPKFDDVKTKDVAEAVFENVDDANRNFKNLHLSPNLDKENSAFDSCDELDVHVDDHCPQSNRLSIPTGPAVFMSPIPGAKKSLHSNITSTPVGPTKQQPLQDCNLDPHSPVFNKTGSFLQNSPILKPSSQVQSDKKEDANTLPKIRISEDRSQNSQPKSSAKNLHDSFFTQNDENFLLAAMTTPKDGKASSSNKNLHEISQITFTQALACVHDSVLVESSGETSYSMAKPFQNSDTNRSKIPVINKINCKELETSGNKENGKKANTSTDMEEAMFDLGVDFDEFDEDLVVPPSPNSNTQPLSQKSQGSQRLSGIRRSSSRSSTNLSMLWNSGKDKKNDNVVKDLKVEEKKNVQTEIPTAVFTIDFSDEDFETLDEVASPPAQNEENTVQMINNDDMATKISPKLSTDDDSDDSFIQVTKRKKKAVMMSPLLSQVQREKPDVSTKRSHDIEEDSDDSFMQNIIKKKRPVILSPGSTDEEDGINRTDTTASTGFKTPQKPAAKAKKLARPKLAIILSDEEEDSEESLLKPNIPAKKTKKTILIPSEDEDDFEDSSAFKPRTTKQRDKELTKIKPKKKRKPRCGFIEDEAELSEDGSGFEDESEDSDFDNMDASFINDETQMSQDNNDTLDTRAMYMKSVRSPGMFHGRGKFKLAYNKNVNMDVFSQVPQEDDEDSYLEDSFCVDNEDDSDLMDYGIDDDGHDTMLEDIAIQNKFKPKPKKKTIKRKPVQNILGIDATDEGNDSLMEDIARQLGDDTKKDVTEGRKRIKKMVFSSSEDEEIAMKESSARTGRTLNISSSSSSSTEAQTSETKSNRLGIIKPKNQISEKIVLDDSSPFHSGYSQMPSLASRCKQRVGMKNVAAPQRSHVKGQEQPLANEAQFSLGMDFEDEDDFENSCFDIEMENKSSTVSKIGVTGKNNATVLQNSVLGPNTKDKTDSKILKMKDYSSQKEESFKIPENVTNNRNSSVIQSKAERLRLSKLRQEEFRKKHANRIQSGCDTENQSSHSGGENQSLREKNRHGIRDEQSKNTLDNLPHNSSHSKFQFTSLTKKSDTKLPQSIASSSSFSTASSSSFSTASSSSFSTVSSSSFSTAPSSSFSTAPSSSFSTIGKRGVAVCNPISAVPEPTEIQSKTRTSSTDSGNDIRTNITKDRKLSSASNTSIASSVGFTGIPERRNTAGKLLVLVDSREINGAQDLVSHLRFKHKLQVGVRQLGTCDYILSNRMAVERKILTDFANGSNRVKLLDRMRGICEVFDRPCLIVEKERVKPGEEKNVRPWHRTKYIDNVMACLSQLHIKVLFSENQTETAEILWELCQQESRKNMSININVELTPAQEQVLQFYLSCPHTSYVMALNLLHNYKSIKDFIGSTIPIIQKRGQMSQSKAKELFAFVRHRFDSQMTRVKR